MKNAPKINTKAILIGVLVDIGGPFLWGIILYVLFAIQGIPATEMEYELTSLLPLSVIIGVGLTFLAGFMSARIAKSAEILHAGIVGAIDVLFVLLFWASSPLWCNILSLLLAIPAAMLGGYVAKSKAKEITL